MSKYKATIKGHPDIRYSKTDLLGQGTFCEVYEAQYKREGADGKKEVVIAALKKLKPSMISPNTMAVNYFEQECKLLVSLNHPNLVKAYTYSIADPNEKWVLMEKYEQNLLEFLTKLKPEEVSEDQAKVMGLAILSGIKELHSMKIVHRDLKLENILMGHGNVPKITDFGLAKQSTQGSKIMLTSFLGTPDYMAPEIYLINSTQQGSYNQSIDIYAFGHIIFTLCSKAYRSEVNGGQGAQINGKHALGFDPNTFEFPENFSPNLKDLLRKCWQKDPSKRPSAVELMSHPWIGLAKPDITPQLIARFTMKGMTDFVQNEKDPSELLWDPISKYMQYSIAVKLGDLSRKLHKRYKHIVGQYEKSTYWEILKDSHPEFEEVVATYEALMATYLLDLGNLKSDQIREQLNLTDFEVWEKDAEFKQREKNFAEAIEPYANGDGESITQSGLAARFAAAVDSLKQTLEASGHKNSRPLYLFITTFAREVTNFVMKLFKITFEMEIDPSQIVKIKGVVLTPSHKQLLCKLIDSRLNTQGAPATIDYSEPGMSSDQKEDFEACSRFIKVNMVLELPAEPIFQDLAVSSMPGQD